MTTLSEMPHGRPGLAATTAETESLSRRSAVSMALFSVPTVALTVAVPAHAVASQPVALRFGAPAYTGVQTEALSGVSVKASPATAGLVITLTLSAGLTFWASGRSVASAVVDAATGFASFPDIRTINGGTLTASSSQASPATANVTFIVTANDLALSIAPSEVMTPNSASSPGVLRASRSGAAVAGVTATISSSAWMFYGSNSTQLSVVTGSDGTVAIGEVFVPPGGGSSRFFASSGIVNSNAFVQNVAPAPIVATLYRVPSSMTAGQQEDWMGVGVSQGGTLQDGFTVTVTLTGPLQFTDGTVTRSVACDSSRPSFIGSIVATASGSATITAAASGATSSSRTVVVS